MRSALKGLALFLAVLAAAGAAHAQPAGEPDPPWSSLPSITDATTPGVHPGSAQGDEIFQPRNVPAGKIPAGKADRTGRLTSVDIDRPEPRLAGAMRPGADAGSRYEIRFPNVTRGGQCLFTGKGRYVVAHLELYFHVLADCGDLRNAFQFHVCRLDPSLHCEEAPWWYFRGHKYAVAADGVTVDATKYAWVNPELAQDKLQQQLEQRAAQQARLAALHGEVLHGRWINCRAYHPERRAYDVHVIATRCVFESLCSGMPDLKGIGDGEELDLRGPIGDFVRRQPNVGDTSNWSCWIRTT